MHIPHTLVITAPAARLALAARRRLFTVAVAVCCLVISAPARGQSADQLADVSIDTGGEISAEVQHELAQRFAPVLVFHGAEHYFPTTPLFPLVVNAPGARPVITAASAAQLGTADERRTWYEALPVQEKARLATVFYRAYHASLDDEEVIVIEYWLYYIHNTYRVRGNLFPLWVDGSHPNDLEHIHLIVRPSDDGRPSLHEVYSSAHNGTMPANRHRYAADHAVERGRFLVELGSHAIAPDVDEDGLYTPGADGSSGYKMLWGIRDRGITWSRYRSGYMDARSGVNSVVFEYAGTSPAVRERLSYQLVPVEELRAAFSELDLSKQQRQAIFETGRHWFRRMFGGDTGSSGKLLVPPPRSRKRSSLGIDRFASTERGILVGTQLNLADQGLLVGGRYAYLLGGRFIPDVMAEAALIVARRTQYLSTQLMVSYPIDGSTTVMAGKALITDPFVLGRHQWDWVAGVEFSLGRMRISGTSRSSGPITGASKEFRLAYLF